MGIALDWLRRIARFGLIARSLRLARTISNSYDRCYPFYSRPCFGAALIRNDWTSMAEQRQSRRMRWCRSERPAARMKNCIVEEEDYRLKSTD